MMARKLQHITTLGQRDDAERDGTKVESLCGQRVYPMTKMKPEIPTCTLCSREMQARYAALLVRPYVVTWSMSTAAGMTTGGAA